jgi:hypothetical protein
MNWTSDTPTGGNQVANSKPCPRCGLTITGTHETAEDCIRHLSPRYQLAQQSLKQMHNRYRSLEDRLERAKIAQRIALQDAKRKSTIPARLAAVEAALGIHKGNEHATR